MSEAQPLDAEDLERLATAAYLMGREDESEILWERRITHTSSAASAKAPRDPHSRSGS